MAINNKEEEEKEEEQQRQQQPFFILSQSLNDWEQIQTPLPPLPPPSSSSSSLNPSQIQIHFRAWDLVHNHSGEEKNRSFIFPPSNHEGLHIGDAEQQQLHLPTPPELEPSSLSSPSDISVEEQTQSQLQQIQRPFDSRIRESGEVLIKKLGLGLEVLCSKLLWVVGSLRSYCCSGRRVVWSIPSPATGVSAAFLVVLLYLWRRRRRRRAREEKIDRLILHTQRTDEKMSQLLDHIAQINELLSARRRVPVLKSD